MHERDATDPAFGFTARHGGISPVVLWTLLALFALRVAGQLAVAAGLAPFLPPMDQWQSGLLPYPVLVASQLAILAVFGTVCVQFRFAAAVGRVLESTRPPLASGARS